ncbi:hypothetical protein [Thiococcus pfennigii]|uniref:hypothetical protein n=1 Tax=Thiococcus pfennigii TaxID=1057 RepID=UPI00190801F1|nr:hypothetical protein [Thiococcus pfennigii]MBK1730592.1 hypothetical protein [Thiococcus pfennigii]
MRSLEKLIRRWQIAALDRLDGQRLVAASVDRAIAQFHRVAREVPAYRAILGERGVVAARIRSPAEFLAHCPILEKRDLFGAYPLAELCVGGRLEGLAGVLTSSGHGGRFAFGLATHRQERRTRRIIELALAYLFQTDQRRTLLINALPMGVRFSCSTVTLAETSVREDMVGALIEQFAPHHEQVILVTDPLFCKRLLDHGRETGGDWGRFRIHVALGEETFGEAFRRYVATGLGQDPDGWTRGFVMSSMGLAELGLNLFFETRETVRLRQLGDRSPERLAAAIGAWPGRVPPLLFVYDPMRIFVEVVAPDADGWGSLTVSTLDRSLRLPLIRYRTGDRAKRLDPRRLAAALVDAHGRRFDLPRLPMIAVTGREADTLPDGRALLDIKDALYARPEIADRLSGAFRVEPLAGTGCRLHLQTTAGWAGEAGAIAEALRPHLPSAPGGTPDEIQVWPYAAFPFGQTLDYERKFTYCTPKRGQSPFYENA